MANPTFPTLSKKPVSLIPKPEDAGLKSAMSDGYAVSRARYTRSRLTFTLEYTGMTYADMEAVTDFYRETTYGAAGVFNWTCDDPNSKYYNTVFKVRMTEAPNFSFVQPYWWNMSLTLEEA